MKLKSIIKEQGNELSMEEFAEKRMKGAAKIAKDAKEKGGPSILTYHHFIVKLPYYKRASDGQFNQTQAIGELQTHLDELCSKASNLEQIRFQELVGIIEVLGELIIKSKNKQ